MWIPSESLLAPLAPHVQAFVRIAYGSLQFLTLAAIVPHAARYFRSERWGGYAESSRAIDAIQNPVVSPLVLAAWICAAAALIAGWHVVAAAALNLTMSYYFFIRMRWRSVLRGMGAPGFLAFWLGAAVFFLELTARRAPALQGLALLTLRVDFALIMLSAGVYKMVAGYRAGEGMELGMVNPEWGYWPRFWSARRPTDRVFRILNTMAWTTEVFAGLAMLIPATRFLGAAAILLSFVFIGTQIRLGFLCEMVIVACALFFGPDTAGGRAIAAVPGLAAHAAPTDPALASGTQTILRVFFWSYLTLLPMARSGMYFNQLAHRRLPAGLQHLLDLYTNLFGLIIWRVFTADVVNFFVRVWDLAPSGQRRLISDYSGFPGMARFRQVAECITITSVFTTLKYYATNGALFRERLLRYARTIPCRAGSRLLFEWVGITRAAAGFAFVPAAEFIVDVAARSIEERTMGGDISTRAAARSSPVHEGARPGSYAPAQP